MAGIYDVLYCLRDHDPIDSAIYRHATIPSYLEAMQERNLLFNNSPSIVLCWIEKKVTDGYTRVGQKLKRK